MGKFANIYATYELTCIKHVISAVQRIKWPNTNNDDGAAWHRQVKIYNSLCSDLAQQNQPIIHYQSLKTTTLSQSKHFSKSVLSTYHILPKLKITQNHWFQDHHIFWEWRYSKIHSLQDQYIHS